MPVARGGFNGQDVTFTGVDGRPWLWKLAKGTAAVTASQRSGLRRSGFVEAQSQ
jgi:hypothetical protein